MVAGGGVLLLLVIVFFGSKTPPVKAKAGATVSAPSETFDIQSVINGATAKLSESQQTYLKGLSEAVVRGDVKEQKI